MSENNQNTNIEIADEQLNDVSGGLRNTANRFGMAICPYCGANMSVSPLTVLGHAITTCPQCGKSVDGEKNADPIDAGNAAHTISRRFR